MVKAPSSGASDPILDLLNEESFVTKEERKQAPARIREGSPIIGGSKAPQVIEARKIEEGVKQVQKLGFGFKAPARTDLIDKILLENCSSVQSTNFRYDSEQSEIRRPATSHNNQESPKNGLRRFESEKVGIQKPSVMEGSRSPKSSNMPLQVRR